MNISIIQRRCGERTENFYLKSYTNFSFIYTAKCSNYYDALSKTLNTAISCKNDWILAVDGDVLLYPKASDICQQIVKTIDAATYEVAFLLDDIPTGIPIYGVHLHRCSLARKFLNFINSQNEVSLRGESKSVKAFLSHFGLKKKALPLVVGNHDDKQFLEDLFRKYVVRGIRYRHRLDELITLLKLQTPSIDRAVAIEAVNKSLNISQNIPFSDLKIISSSMFKSLGIRERLPLSGDILLPVDNIIRYSPMSFP